MKNLIIVGGNLQNKGSQAMVFTLIDNLKRINPKVKIYLFVKKKSKKSKLKKTKYNFVVKPWSYVIKKRLLTITIFDKHKHLKEVVKELKVILKKSSVMIDVSGFGLSSKLFTNSKKNFQYTLRHYLLNIIIAKKYSIPYYILPQSFGPFNYSFLHQMILWPLIKICLKYPKKIFARDLDSYNLIKKMGFKNVNLEPDIVLTNQQYYLKNIFKKIPKIKEIKIPNNSVGIVLNQKIKERLGHKDYLICYKAIINQLLDLKKNIFLLTHSEEDKILCTELKEIFKKQLKVFIVNNHLNCFELEKLIAQFDFIICSRYHAVIHAYKHNIPVLCIGWANKYFSLLNDFSQLRYFFDIGTTINYEKLIHCLNQLTKRVSLEKKIIQKNRQRLIKNSKISTVYQEMAIL